MTVVAKVSKVFTWEMGHRLPAHEGKCRSLHGHNYQAWVSVKGPVNPGTGMVIDFGGEEFDLLIENLIHHWDHATMLYVEDPLADYLLKAPPHIGKDLWLVLVDDAPTAETIASIIAGYCSEVMPRECYGEVTVWETEKASACVEWA